ncbi:MAG: 30S ribosomal protein S8e [archaeon]
MAKYGRKASGGRYHKQKKKKFYSATRVARVIKIGKLKRKTLRLRGGNKKVVLLSADTANILCKDKKVKKSKIKTVLETPSNRFLARQNILTKGSIIDTELGKARVTNRPSQEGQVNAVLIE